MKYSFTADNDNYVVEHDRFLKKLILSGSLKGLTGIIYKGDLPRDCRVVKFSDYLNINGCVQVSEGFCGLFGTKSYTEVLKSFVRESVEEYEGTPYKLDIDVSLNPHDNTSDNLSYYVDNLMISK